MTQVTIYLRTSLFTLKDGHVPTGAMIIKAQVDLESKGGLHTHAQAFLDAKGKLIEERSVKVLIPWGKIDHLHLDDA